MLPTGAGSLTVGQLIVVKVRVGQFSSIEVSDSGIELSMSSNCISPFCMVGSLSSCMLALAGVSVPLACSSGLKPVVFHKNFLQTGLGRLGFFTTFFLTRCRLITPDIGQRRGSSNAFLLINFLFSNDDVIKCATFAQVGLQVSFFIVFLKVFPLKDSSPAFGRHCKIFASTAAIVFPVGMPRLALIASHAALLRH